MTKGYFIAGQPVSDAVGEEFGRLIAERDALRDGARQPPDPEVLGEFAAEAFEAVYFMTGEGELLQKINALCDAVEARARATPPDGPVWWFAMDSIPDCVRVFDCEPYERRCEGDVTYGAKGGAIARLPLEFAAALGLAPGACQRFRLAPIPEGET